MSNVSEIVKRCLTYSDEPEWFDFKENWFKVDEIGQYISALSNAAAMAGEPFGYMVWGVHDESHELTDTKVNYNCDVSRENHEPVQHYLSRKIRPAIFFRFDEDVMDGKRVVVLSIPAARTVPTAFDGIRYIRIGSSKEDISKYPEREAALFRVLDFGPPTLVNTPAERENLTFDQLFLYYDSKGIKLKEDTFKENLELLLPDGRYNMLAQLLSDNPHRDIVFALFNGRTKSSVMYADRNFGNMCLLLALDKVLDYGDIINVPQADERGRKVERKEVMLFNNDAFREAVINAFAHNSWVDGVSPMFTAFQDRIEITSIGRIPPKQTIDGFFRGVSIPVNRKLSEIFLQLHISERSGRGVPRIVEEYGESAFEFTNNAIIVTLPFERVDHGVDAPVNALVNAPVNAPVNTSLETGTGLTGSQTGEGGSMEEKIVNFCQIPRSIVEIAEHLGYRDKRTVRKYLKPLLEMGRISRTVPDKPNSRNQKYIRIK